MNFYVMTLFPEQFLTVLHSSILGRAQDAGLIHVELIDIRQFSENKHNRVDDYTYGGGAGMLMAAPPVYRTYRYIMDTYHPINPKVIYLTPQGSLFKQQKAEELACETDIILLCGHYEGIDERVLRLIVTDYVSVGDYVLTGGELPAMIMIDCISRLVPGVLNNEASAEFESFQDSLLEYPQYTRPEEFMGEPVPQVLLSGHHANIEKWRREQSLIRTAERRPELLIDACLTEKEKAWLINTLDKSPR
jgi:tRNA (guanine37-N1)-methyltransferase